MGTPQHFTHTRMAPLNHSVRLMTLECAPDGHTNLLRSVGTCQRDGKRASIRTCGLLEKKACAGCPLPLKNPLAE